MVQTRGTKRKLVEVDSQAEEKQNVEAGESVDEIEAVAERQTLDDVERPAQCNESSQLYFRCSPRRYVKVCKSLNDECKNAVIEMGFGKLLQMSGVDLSHKLLSWMVENINVEDRSLSICGKTFKLTSALFEAIMGVSDGGDEFEQEGTDSDVQWRKDTLKGGNKVLKVGQLEADLLQSVSADNVFIMRFVLYTMGTVLMPTTSVTVGTGVLESISGVHSVRNKNWATNSLNYVVEAAKKYQQNRGSFIGGCVIFLQVLFLHHLEGHTQYIDNNMTPIKAWTEKKTRNVLAMCDANGDYNLRKLREPMIDEAGVRKGLVERQVLTLVSEVNNTKKELSELKQVVYGLRDSIAEHLKKEIRSAIEEVISKVQSSDRDTTKVETRLEPDTIGKTTSSGQVKNNAHVVRTDMTIEEENNLDNENECRYEVNDADKVMLDDNTTAVPDMEIEIHSVENLEAKKSVQKIDSRVKARNEVGWLDVMKSEVESTVIMDDDGVLRTDAPSPSESAEDIGIEEANFVRRVVEYVTMKGHRFATFGTVNILKEAYLQLALYIFDDSLSQGEIIARFGRYDLRRMHLLGLCPSSLICGTVIDCYAYCLSHALRTKLAVSHVQEIWCLPSTFSVAHTTTTSTGQKKVMSILQKGEAEQWRHHFFGDFSKCKKIVLPMYSNEDIHWFAAVVNVSEKSIVIWDSMSMNDRTRSRRGKIVKEQMKSLQSLLASDIELAYPHGLNFDAFEIIHNQDIPQQNNIHDCAIYTMKCMWAVAVGLTCLSEFDSAVDRFQIAIQLVTSNLNEFIDSTLKNAKNNFVDVVLREWEGENSNPAQTMKSKMAVGNPITCPPNLNFATKKQRNARWVTKPRRRSSRLWT